MDSSQSFRSPSPDPLAISQENIAASSPTRITPKTTPRKPLQHSAGNICSQDFYLTTPPAPSFSSSPLKPGHLAGNPTSPWRIRVTVEAEPKHARDASPGRLLTRHTTTTTVPLKTGVDSSPAPAKRGRGRPRKSLDGPMESSGTTKTKITRKRKTMAEVVEGKATEAISESATPVRRGRGRPRKSLGSEIHGSEAGMVEEEEIGIQQSVNPDEPDPEQRKPRSKSRDRRKAISPTTASASDTGGTPFTVEQNHVAIVSEIGTPRMQAGDSCGSSPEESPYPTSALGRADEAKWRSKLRHDSLSPVCHNQETSARNWAFSCISKTKRVGPNTDPTEEHQEYDSIIESEGFSMISHSSLPSAQQASVGALVLDDPNTLQAPANRVASRGDIPAASLQRLSDHKTPAVAPSPQQPPPLLSARARPSPRQLEKSTGDSKTNPHRPCWHCTTGCIESQKW